MTEQQAMRMALEAFEEIIYWYALRDRNDVLLNFVDQNPEIKKAMQAITALRQALDVDSIDTSQKRVEKAGENVHMQQLADEPVAWMDEDETRIFFDKDRPNPMDYSFWKRLYRVPQPAAWVGLTDEEIDNISAQKLKWQVLDLALAIEAALRSKNT